jgi:hypothetical protein
MYARDLQRESSKFYNTPFHFVVTTLEPDRSQLRLQLILYSLHSVHVMPRLRRDKRRIVYLYMSKLNKVMKEHQSHHEI